MRLSSTLVLVLTSVLIGVGTGCATTEKRAYSVEELRAEVARRAPTVPPDDVVVPFQLSEEHAARARRLVRDAQSDAQRVRILAESLFDPKGFNLSYDSSATADAEGTLKSGHGNCLSLASVFIGLARSVGLKAYYLDASSKVHETRRGEDGMTVNVGHVTAVAKLTSGQLIALDLERLGPIRSFRIIDDMEALAHFYNNRGFDPIDNATDSSEVDWARAEHDFRLSVQVLPSFSLGWNNLGVAAEHLGRLAEAMDDYRTSIAHDVTFAAPLNNLGSLQLETGDIAAALHNFQAAAKLEPRGPHIQYNLALARLQSGDRSGAIQALREAIDLRRDYPEAEALLHQLTVASGG
jgi:tetratricopeptide (TPR) repeat protein